MRQLAVYIMRGRFQAASVAGLFGGLSMFIPPLSYLSGAAVGLVVLRHGIKEAVFVLAGAALLTALMVLAGAGTPAPALVLLLVLWLPVSVCATVLRITQSQGWVVLTVGSIVTLFAVGMHLLTNDPVAWWQQWVDRTIKETPIEGVTIDQIAQEGTFVLMNGLVAMVIGVSLMLTLLLARWWQALLYNPGGFRTEFHALRLPRVLAPPMVVMAALVISGFAGNGGSILIDIVVIGIMMYLFQGVAVVHGIVARRNLAVWWIVPIYVGLLLIPPNVILGLAMLGLVDSIVDFRARRKSGS